MVEPEVMDLECSALLAVEVVVMVAEVLDWVAVWQVVVLENSV